MFTDLIHVSYDKNNEPTVSGRGLHQFLKLETRYNDWIKRIIDYGFIENVDYIAVTQKRVTAQGNNSHFIGHILKIGMAKEICMIQRSSEGRKVRAYFIHCEELAKKLVAERQQWEIERAKGVLIRHILTDTIKLKIADTSSKRFAYPNYTKLIYKTIFDKTMDEMRGIYKIKAKESLRDHLSVEDIKEIEAMEMLVSSLINIGMGYQEIKQFISEHYDKKQIKLA